MMTGSDFERRVKKLARRRGVPVSFDASHGKGSHGRLYYGERFTTLKDRKKEIGPGLLKAMLDQLGLTKEDLERGSWHSDIDTRWSGRKTVGGLSAF
jgi:mRNA interferase HicA